MKTVRIGFVGAGGNTRLRHLPGFKAIEGVELAVVANRTRASAEAVAGDFGIARVADHWEQVVSDPEVDAVCIGTWPNLHAPVTLAALSHGKHVLTEARMAASLAEARSMMAAAEQRPQCVTQIVPSPFTLEIDAVVAGLIADGAIGVVREVHVEHATAALANPAAPLSWRQRSELSGCNMLTLGIYHEAVQRWIPDEVSWVAAVGSCFIPERIDRDTGERLPVGLPDSLAVVGRFAGGALLDYHFSGIERGDPRNEIRITGSLATLRIDIGSQQVFVASPDQDNEEEVAIPEESRRGWQVESDFIRSIREGAPVKLTSFADGLRYMRFTDAVHRSWLGDGERVVPQS